MSGCEIIPKEEPQHPAEKIDGVVEMPGVGGSKYIELGGVGMTIENPDEADWCYASIEERTLILNADANTTGKERSVTYRVSGRGTTQTVEVHQEVIPHVKLTSYVPAIDDKGGTFMIGYESDVEVSVQVEHDAARWMKAKLITGENPEIELTVDPNNLHSERSGEVSLVTKSGTPAVKFTVTQGEYQSSRKIYYTTTDDKALNLSKNALIAPSDATILTESYMAGKGIITLSKDIYEIEELFRNCTTLKSITLPSSVTVVGEKTFFNCKNLEEVRAAGLKEVGNSAFENCIKLGTIDLSNVISFGENAFYDTALKEMRLAEGLTDIPDYCFYSSMARTVELPTTLKRIGREAFSSTPLGAITIPDGVEELGVKAFYSCPSLSQVTIGKGVLKVGDSCFAKCLSLKQLSFPAMTTNFGSRCFEEGTMTLSLYINKDVVGNSATDMLYGFKGKFMLPADNGANDTLIEYFQKYKDIRFDGPCASYDGRCLIVDGVLYCANLYDYGNSFTYYYTFPNTIKKVEYHAIVRGSVAVYGNSPYVFIFNEGLEETCGMIVDVPGAGSSNKVFEIQFPASLKKMGRSANIYYSDNGYLTYNGNMSWAFQFDSATPPQLDVDFVDPMYVDKITIYVPAGSEEAYKSAWPKYSSRIKTK